MIVRDDIGIVWRLLWGAILDAVRQGRLQSDDPRINAILDWMSSPGDES